MKKAIGILLIFVAICCAVVMSAKRVPKEEITTTSTTESTTTTTTEPTTEEITTEVITDTTTTEKRTTERYTPSPRVYDDNEYITPEYFKRMGEIYADGYRYTWYSEKVLPGRGLNIPGRYSDGNYVRDENDYIVLASIDLPEGTVMETPFGWGKVYDVCPTSGTIDVYVSW